MINALSSFFDIAPGVVRGIAVGALVALCASLLGTTLVLKRFSMIGDGLSHVAFGAMAAAAGGRGLRLFGLPYPWLLRRRLCFFASAETMTAQEEIPPLRLSPAHRSLSVSL